MLGESYLRSSQPCSKEFGFADFASMRNNKTATIRGRGVVM
jgi:hypothetical protein